jgi:hypothetical protein
MATTALASQPLPDQGDPVVSGHKVTMCHATSSSNPKEYWEVITVDVASSGGRSKLRGHVGHTEDPKQDGRLDVIPGFTYDDISFGGATDPGNDDQWEAFLEQNREAEACGGDSGSGIG